MTPRRRALFIVGLSLILIGIIVFSVLLLRRTVAQPPVPEQVEPDLTQITESAPAPSDFVNPLIVEPEPALGSTASRQMAELFAERYGSYSNQGDYENLRDLLPIMTARYRRSTEAFLKTAESRSGQPFEGVTSKKVSAETRNIDDDSAVIAVSLQQERTSGSAAPTVGYRTLRMELQLVGDDWRVAASTWED